MASDPQTTLCATCGKPLPNMEPGSFTYVDDVFNPTNICTCQRVAEYAGRMLPIIPTEAMKRAGAAQMWEEHKEGVVGLPGAERIYKAMIEAYR